LKIKTIIVSSRTVDSKPVKQEVNSTVILAPLVFPGKNIIMTFKRMTLSKTLIKPFNQVSIS